MKRVIIILSTCIGIAGIGLGVKKGIDIYSFSDSCRSDYISTSEELKEKAKSITVKVMSANGGGSGTIIARKKNIYTVLTNQHVLFPRESYRIQTADGLIYPAKLVKKVNFASNDLALLEFTGADDILFGQDNSSTYTQISVPSKDEEVLASGFSAEGNVLTFNTGRISMLPNKAFQGGYRIGYTSNIQKGMSGGPILNRWGKLVGINGIHAHPLFGNPYIFEGGSKPSEAKKQQMTRLSWGIPIHTLSKFTPELIRTDATNKIEEIAQKITVLITSPNGNGSGFIVAHQGENYYVLTANHVISSEAKYKITTADGKCHQVNYKTIKRFKGTDLAVLKFTSKKNYQVATLGKYELNKENQNIVSFVSGWSALKQGKLGWRFSTGYLWIKEAAHLLMYNSSSFTQAYNLLYTNLTADGMSGGPVLDSSGRVIGIHGATEGEEILDEAKNLQKIQLGHSLGMPISSFITLVNTSEIKPEWLKVETSAPTLLTNITIDLTAIPSSGDVFDYLNLCNQLWRQIPFSLDSDRYETTIKCLDRATRIKPDFYQAYYLKSFVFFTHKQYQEALYSIEKAIQINPKYYQAWRLRGLFLSISNPVEAIDSLNQAIQLNPQDSMLYSLQGSIFYNLNRSSEAVDSFNKAIELTSDFAFNYLGRSISRMEIGDIKGALADYNKSIHLGAKVYSIENLGTGAFSIEKIDTMFKKYADEYLTRGFLRLATEDKQGGIMDLEKAAQIYQNQGSIADYQQIQDTLKILQSSK